MSHKDRVGLEKKLDRARELVVEGGRYRHSKTGNEYVALSSGILEATEEVAVIYEAVERKGMIWIRTLENFLEEVEIEGKKVGRFVLMEEGK